MHVTVLFSKIKDEIINNLKKSSKEIKVAVAWFTDEDIIRILTQKNELGINVRIVISDSTENFKNNIKFKDFIKKKGQLYVSTNPFMHHKFCIIDDKLIINGSYNWSYPARGNEENILLLYLDINLKEDEDLLKRFNTKHRFLCEKCSMEITDMESLNAFSNIAKDSSKILSVLDENEIKLREEFENDVKESFEKAIISKIPISHLLLERMKSDGGGVEFVKRILHNEMSSGEMKSGFKKLEDAIPHRVDLSLEYLVSRPKYESLVRSEEISFCKNLMSRYDL